MDRTEGVGGSAGYGGVLLAIKTDLNSQQVAPQNKSELVMATLKIGRKVSALVGCCYRGPSTDESYANTITDTIRVVHQKQPKDTVCILGGDYNLPDVNWEDQSISGHQNTLAINNTFLNTFQDLGLEQIVEFPTRHNPDNTLDLILTNRPTLIQRCEPIPGLSDHIAVLVTTKLQAGPRKPIRRKIHLWKKADTEGIRDHVNNYSETFHSQYTVETPVEELWTNFSKEVKWIMDNLVPSKMSTIRFNQPWINTEIKRLTRRKKKAYAK